MKIKEKILVTGIRKFKGDIDGNSHDFTKLTYILLSNSLENDREKGYFTTEVLAGTSSVFEEISKFDFPAIFEADFSIALNRKGQSNLELNSYKYIKSLSIE